MKESRPKVKVTARALFQRIDRKLKRNGEKLCTAKSDSTKEELGHYYIVRPSGVVRADVDLGKLGRELGVLQPWEEFGDNQRKGK